MIIKRNWKASWVFTAQLDQVMGGKEAPLLFNPFLFLSLEMGMAVWVVAGDI